MRNTQENRRTRTRRLAGAGALAMAFVAQHASAVALSPHGIGQALIYPYYTVNKNQDTLVSVTNASDVGKAIQVRFREGMNGRDALSFVLLLGAHDTWTVAMTASGDEFALVDTNDTSCTLPSFPTGGTTLRSAGYDGTGTLPADGGPQSAVRTREGFFELIVGGDVIAGSPTDLAMKRPANGGKPACPADDHAFVQDLEDPTKSGIFGSAAILNVGSGTYYAYNADALQGVADDVMFLPGAPYPGPQLSDARTNEGIAGTTRAYVTTTDGHGLGLDYHSGIDAVSAVFMANAIYNDYLVSASLGAATDWVVTFPTKQYYVDTQYGAVPRKPFGEAFASGEAPVLVGGQVFDREQRVEAFDGACDANCPPALLPYQVNVIGIGRVSSDFSSPVLGSSLDATFMPAAGESGHALMWLTDPDDTRVLTGGTDVQRGEEVRLHGLPVTGFMVYNVVNANAAPGMLANYSAAFPHRRTVACEGGTFGCPMHLDH